MSRIIMKIEKNGIFRKEINLGLVAKRECQPYLRGVYKRVQGEMHKGRAFFRAYLALRAI